ncbi:RNA-directed DNA polymerase from mobile element jockey [Cryptotermes secundus]|uniref:RNA-directed DNA polymerase from mobile element jockey n=1 Tax=Cryptotermes secundus TaxID=105785 RepID=A0A2J7RD70_9NEOP|nr:RNA-directed DNA polymerase from mobile element jockey [Cryptotermes secundus]
MAKFLKIALWNANGLLQHKDEIKIFLDHNAIDILLVSETHFTDRTYLRIPHYNAYFTNHPDNTAHAGTGILIKNNISHYELPKFEKNFLQATAIKVKMKAYELTVAAVYCPPRHNIKEESFYEFFRTLGNKFIAGGDYNCKNTQWGSRLTTTKGRELSKIIRNQQYSFLSTGTPTYWPSDPDKIPDLLDFYITSGISTSYMDIVPSYDLSSDHTPVIATISTEVVNKKTIPRLHNRRTDWADYRMKIEQAINLHISLKTPDELDIALTNFINILKEAALHATPIPTTQTRSINIPTEIKKLIADKRRARKTWQLSHAPADRTVYNRATNKLRAEIKKSRELTLHNYLRNLNRYDNSIWTPVKSTKKPIVPVSPLKIQIDGRPDRWARSDKEKAELFAAHLSKVFMPNASHPDQEIENDITTLPPNIPTIKIFSPKEIKEEIGFLNIKKAPGIDKITPKMMKELPKKGLVMLTYIYNAMLRLSIWPKQLKTAEIILIPKPGKDPKELSSYRPISLLSIINKLFEKLLLRRLNMDLKPDEWMPPHQFGFRNHHSTIQQTHRIIHKINQALEDKQYCTSIFIDVSQAFDKVWHDGLLFKIKKVLPIKYFRLLKSYLSDRKFRTRVKEEVSSNFIIQSGVPQGSVLGPILYVLFTTDLPTTTYTTTGTFADDTVILASHDDPATASQRLQSHLDQVESWLKKWRIHINETKSVQVTFTMRKEQCPAVHINNTEIPQSSTVKYLGLHLDSRLTWKQHITKKRKQVDLKVKDIHWIIGSKSSTSLDSKVLLYKTIIKPIWTYGIELWGCASKSNIAIMQRRQSKILRMITNAPWYVSNQTLHDDLNVPFVKEVIQERSIKHHDKLGHHSNTLLQPLLEQQQRRRLKKLWPADLLDG